MHLRVEPLSIAVYSLENRLPSIYILRSRSPGLDLGSLPSSNRVWLLILKVVLWDSGFFPSEPHARDWEGSVLACVRELSSSTEDRPVFKNSFRS